MLRKLLGIAHCAACDITHGPRTEKPEFTALKASGWNVPVSNIHRDEMDTSLAGLVGDVLPAVVARTMDGTDTFLLGPRQLDECSGSVVTLEASINAALAGAHLFVPPFPAQVPRRRPAGERPSQIFHSPSMPSRSALVPESSGEFPVAQDLVELESSVPVTATEVRSKEPEKLMDVDNFSRLWRPQVVPSNSGMRKSSSSRSDDSVDDAVVPEL